MLNGILSPAGSDELGWDEIQRRRKFAEALMSQGADYSPVGSWTQGLARMAQGLVGGYEAGKMEKEEKAANQPINEAIAAYLRGGAAPSPTPGLAASGGANLPGDMSTWANAIRKKESGSDAGNYAAVGPTHPTMGRALGAYQVMESNIGPWSREALGREVTPDEFLRNPQIQDQIFQHKFGQYVQKYGNPQDAASAWFTGRPLAQGANARDVLGTTGAQYVADFNRNSGAAPVQVAQAGGMASDAPAAYAARPPINLASAPAQQAIDTAMPQNPPLPPARPAGIGGPAMMAGSAPIMDASGFSGGSPAPAPTAPDGVMSGVPMAGGASPAAAPPPADRPAANAAPAGPAPQRVAQALMPQTAAPGAGPDPRTALLAAALSPRANPALAQKAMMLYQLTQKPSSQFTKVGEDEFGRPIMGWVNERSQTVTPIAAPGAASSGPSSVPPPPPGVDPKEWRKIHTERQAQAAAGPKGEEVTSLRKEVQQLPSYKNLAQAAPIYQSMSRAANVDSRAADLDLVYGLAKIFDPGSVVREGEMVMVNATASIPDQIKGFINSVNGGQRLTPETRAAVMNQAYSRIQGYNDQFAQDAQMYRGIAGRNRMNEADVLPNFGEFKPWQPSGQAARSQRPPGDVPVRVTTPEEARKLPSGTRIILPDGTEGRVP